MPEVKSNAPQDAPDTSWTSLLPKSGSGRGLSLKVVWPEGNRFYITSEPRMPEIEVALGSWQSPGLGKRAVLEPCPAEMSAKLQFTWEAVFEFRGGPECVHSVSKHGPVIVPPVKIFASSIGGSFKLRFPVIRGGDLTVSVNTAVAQEIHTVKSKGLKIGATNPSLSELATAFPNDVLKRIARHESGARQFMADPGCKAPYPLFSGDNLGGVGLFQITRPAPSPEQIWDWRANLAAGISIYESKRKVAMGYPVQCREYSKRYAALVADFNAKRVAANQPAISVVLPDFTDDQIDDDAIRGFNGFGGTDVLGQAGSLREFQIPVLDNRIVIEEIDEKKRVGILKWQRTPTSKRFHVAQDKNGNDHSVATGDPDYVRHVRGAILSR